MTYFCLHNLFQFLSSGGSRLNNLGVMQENKTRLWISVDTLIQMWSTSSTMKCFQFLGEEFDRVEERVPPHQKSLFPKTHKLTHLLILWRLTMDGKSQ